MNPQASERQCPRCKAPTAPQTRFCTGCGTSLQSPPCGKCGEPVAEGARFCTGCGAQLVRPACSHCGAALPDGARFCTGCGTQVSSPPPAGDETVLGNLIASLDQALRRANPRRVLQPALDCLAKTPTTEQAVIASVLAMSSCAQLGDFAQARQRVVDARRLYGLHLGLSEDQVARFVQEGVLVDDLQEPGGRDLQDNPWIYFIMGHAYGPDLPDVYIGDTAADKNRTAMGMWSEFINSDRNRYSFFGALAFLQFTNNQYRQASQHFETIVLKMRRYESISPVRIELLWPMVMAGDCYGALKEDGRAAACWNRARSIGMCAESDAGLDDWGRFALPWIEKAKSRLLERGMAHPPPELSRQSSDYLRSAIQYQLEAEQFETKDGGLDELVDGVRQAGRRYTVPLDRANAALENMKPLDPFAWALVPIKDSSTWWRYESAKGLLLLKTSFVHLSGDKLALAIAACKQAMDVWPSLTTGAMLGGLQAICGLKADARATYGLCLSRAEELAFDQSSSDREQALAEIREALSQPSLLVER